MRGIRDKGNTRSEVIFLGFVACFKEKGREEGKNSFLLLLFSQMSKHIVEV
jgi:hypothetical protein